jgi:chromosomal replication initiation ATPase DnaA
MTDADYASVFRKAWNDSGCDPALTARIIEKACAAVRKRKAAERVSSVVRMVANHFSVSRSTVSGTCRERWATGPRFVAFWVLRNAYKMSFPKIIKAFSGRDHSLAIYGVRKVDSNPKLLSAAKEICANVRGESREAA